MKNRTVNEFAAHIRGHSDGVFFQYADARDEAAATRAWRWTVAYRHGGVPVLRARKEGAAAMRGLITAGIVEMAGATVDKVYRLTARGWAATNEIPSDVLHRCVAMLRTAHDAQAPRGDIRQIPPERLTAAAWRKCGVDAWRLKSDPWSPAGPLLHLAVGGLLFGVFSDNPDSWGVRLTQAGLAAAESWPIEFDAERLTPCPAEWARGYEAGRELARRGAPKEHRTDVPPRCRP